MKKYEQIKAKYREKAFPIIDERTFDEAVNEILEENAYLRRLALHALSSWATVMSVINYLDKSGSRKKQIAYFMVSKKFENLHNIAKQKWRDKRFVKNLKVQITLESQDK